MSTSTIQGVQGTLAARHLETTRVLGSLDGTLRFSAPLPLNTDMSTNVRPPTAGSCAASSGLYAWVARPRDCGLTRRAPLAAKLRVDCSDQPARSSGPCVRREASLEFAKLEPYTMGIM